MKQYPKIQYPEDTSGLFASDTVYVQEKVDGANARLTLEDNIESEYHTKDREVAFGSRNVEFKNQRDEPNQFADSISYVRDSVNTDILRGYDEKYGGVVLFGEYMIPHIISYNWDKWEDKFVGFDVWSIDQQRFLPPQDAVDLFDAVGLPYTDVRSSHTTKEWQNGETPYHAESGNWPEDDSWCLETKFGDGLSEGVVIKNPTTQTYAKMVREEFREKHQTGKMDEEETDAQKLSYQYITDARIEKTAHKLVDKGEYDELSIEMMQDLPREVIRDMAEEESYNVFMYESWTVDLEKFRSVTSDRCSQVLRRLISMES